MSDEASICICIGVCSDGRLKSVSQFCDSTDEVGCNSRSNVCLLIFRTRLSIRSPSELYTAFGGIAMVAIVGDERSDGLLFGDGGGSSSSDVVSESAFRVKAKCSNMLGRIRGSGRDGMTKEKKWCPEFQRRGRWDLVGGTKHEVRFDEA